MNRSLREERLTARFFAATSLVGPSESAARWDIGTARPRSESLLVDQGTMSWEAAAAWNTPRSRRKRASPAPSSGIRSRCSGIGTKIASGSAGSIAWASVARRDAAWTVDRRFLDGAWASRERKLEVTGNWEPHSRERAWLSLGRQHLDASDDTFRRDQWEIGLGWERPLPWDLSFEIESLFFVGIGSLDADRTRVNVRVMRSFAFGGGAPGSRSGSRNSAHLRPGLRGSKWGRLPSGG